MSNKNQPLVIALAAALVFSAGCTQQQAASPGAPPPPTVTVAAVQAQTITEWEEFTGRTEALETVEVRPRVSGHLEEVRFTAGQMVKEGDVLFLIDQRSQRAELARAEAEFVRAQVRVKTAEQEAKRTAQLLAAKAISTEEADARMARADEARAGALAAEAARNTAQLDLEFTEIKAPISGRIGRALVTPGNHVSGVPGFTTVLATIVTVDPVYVYSDMDETTLLRLNGLIRDKKLSGKIPAQLTLGEGGGEMRQGFVESVDNRLDPATGSILLRTVFPNPDGSIVPGLFARVRIPISEEHVATLVDERAIGTDQSQKFVLSLTSSNTVAYRGVKLGPTVNGKRVVRSGIQPGDQIVVNGLQRVRPGMPVTPVQEGAETTNAVQTAAH